MTDSPKDRKSACYEQIRKAILTLELEPSCDLDEAQLSEDFGISRTPLREVFRQLSGEGYLEMRANRGARVSAMTHTTLRDFFLAAPMIYAAITRLAAGNATAAQIAALKEAQRSFKQSLRNGSAQDRTLANYRFHEITGDMASNVYLRPSFNRLLIDHARIGMTFYRPHTNVMAEKLSLASEQHDAIIAAIEARDEAAAARLAEEHWQLSRGQIELFVMPAALDLPLGKLA